MNRREAFATSGGRQQRVMRDKSVMVAFLLIVSLPSFSNGWAAERLIGVQSARVMSQSL